MLKLEQLAAVVVAAGLAIVSYWLFFSWAGGGGYERRDRSSQHSSARCSELSEASACLDDPVTSLGVIEAGEVGFDLLRRHG